MIILSWILHETHFCHCGDHLLSLVIMESFCQECNVVYSHSWIIDGISNEGA